MVLETIEYTAGVSAALVLDENGRCAVAVRDADLGDTMITGFGCEADARTFLFFGDFDDTADNTARRLAEMTGLHWS